MSDWERGRTHNREIATLRKRYAEHREAISRLMADAPTERLAQTYGRVRSEIDAAIAKIDEIDGGAGGAIDLKQAAPAPAAAATTHPALRGAEAGSPLTIDQELLRDDYIETPERRRFPAAALVGVVLVALLVVAFVVWRFARNNEPADRIVEEPTTAVPSTITEEPGTVTPVQAQVPLSATPSEYDYGIVRKGTRKSQNFTLTNNSQAPLTVSASRSQCRCLWFDLPNPIPPGGTGSLTITVDGARASSGVLSEVVQVGTRERTDVTADIEVRATVQ